MKYYLLISLLHLYCILSSQSSNCDNYTTYKTEAAQLAKQDPRLALMKYETMKKCDPARAQREGVDKDIVALFKDLIVAQEQAVANKTKAEEAKAAAIKAGKELDKALVKAYYAQAKSAYEAGEFKKALELSKKVQQLDPQKELGDLEPKLIESRIPDDRFCGEPLRDRGVLNNLLYGEAPCNALTNRKHNLRWDNIITRPVIEWDKDNSDMGYLFMLQKKENQSDYGELIILVFNDASEDEIPKEVGRCRIPIADLQKWENEEYVHNRDGFFHIGEWGYFSENTANFAIFSPKNNTLKMFENTEFQYGGGEGNILAAFEKDGAVYVEQYGLPYLNFMDKYQVDENGDRIYAADQITYDIQPGHKSYKNRNIVYGKRLVGGRFEAAGIYLQDSEKNKLSPILEVERLIHNNIKVVIDSTREQVTIIEYYNDHEVLNFVVYDINANASVFNWASRGRTGDIMYKLDSPDNRLYTWYALRDSILTASDGAGTYLFYDGDYTRWNQRGKVPETHQIAKFEYISSGQFPKAFCSYYWDEKAEIPQKIALFEVWGGALIKSWEHIVSVKTVEYKGENTKTSAQLLVEYTDPNNPAHTLTDLVFCANDSMGISVLSLQNTPIETLYPIPGHYISKKNKPNGKAELSVYQLAYAKKFFPENIRFLGTIETDSLSNEDVTGDILTVQSNFKKGRLWDYEMDTSDIAFYQLPELKIIDTVQRVFSIGEFNSTHPALFIVRTINHDAKIYDPYKHLAFTRGNWGGFFEAFFLDSARTLLAVEYLDTLQSLKYSKLDILTYPGLKLQTSLNLTNDASSGAERTVNQIFKLAPGDNLIYNRYFTVCADMIDSTASQTAYLYKVLPGKLQLLDRYKVRNNFMPPQITLSAINGPAPKEEKSEYESYAPPGYYEIVTPDQPVDIPVPEYETIQARYFSKKYMLHFEQEIASDAFNVSYYALDSFALVKDWKHVDRIDSIDSKILKITFEKGEIEYFDTELKTKTDYAKPQQKVISNIKIVFENEKLQITQTRDSTLIRREYSDYGSDEYELHGVFQLLHKKSKSIKTWDIHTPYQFDAERERLVLFNYNQKNYEVCKDTLLIYDCKNGISEIDKIVGQALQKDSHGNFNKNYWVQSNLKMSVSDSSTAPLLYIVESDNNGSPVWITLHTLDLKAAKNFHTTLKYENKSELTILDKFGFLMTDDGTENSHKTLQIFDLLKGKPINNTKWNLPENAQIHVLNPLIVGFEDVDSVYFMYDLEAMKVKANYKSVALIYQNDYGREQKYIGGNYWITFNKIDKNVKSGDDFYLIKKFDLDVFEGLSFDKTILRLKDVQDFYFEGDLLFTLVYVQKEEGYVHTWKVYDAKNSFQIIGTWEDAELKTKEPYYNRGKYLPQWPYLSTTNTYKKFAQKNDDTLTVKTFDYTLFKPDNPKFRLVLKDGIINGDLIANNFDMRDHFFDFFYNQKSENMGDLQLFRSDDLTPAGLWKDVNKSSKPVVINDSVLLVQYNCRDGIYDLDLKMLPSLDSIRTYRGISDWAWLPDDSSIAIVRPMSTDSANIAYSGELRGVNDNRLIAAFILPFYFELANDPVDNSYRDEKDLDYNKLVFSTAVDLDEKYAEHLELREGYREKDYLRGVLGFRRGRAFLLPQGYITVDRNPMVVCTEQPYSISITKDEQDSELGKRYWNIQAYSYSTQDTDFLPEPVFKTPKRIEANKYSDEKPAVEFNKAACEILIREKVEHKIYKLKN